MFSINTDVASAIALANLRDSSFNLDQTQNRISTGLKVENPVDEASDFAIAQGIRTDLQGQLAVAGEQAQAQGVLGVTNTALTSISNTLSQMKSIAVQASSGVNSASQLSAFQNQFTALANQVDSTAQGATYNGVNLLTPPPSVGFIPVAQFVLQGAGATVQAGDALTLNFQAQLDSPNGQDSPPYNASVTLTRIDTLSGGGTATTTIGTQTIPTQVVTAGAGAAAPTLTFNDAIPAGVTSSTYALTITQTNGVGTGQAVTTTQYGTGPTYTIGSAFNIPLSSQDNDVFDGTESAALPPPLTFQASATGNSTLLVNYTDVSSSSLALSGLNLATNATGALNAVDAAMTSVGDDLGYYGEQSQLFSSISTFNQSIADAVTQGLGALVDANLPQQAAKLQAEQISQQLSAQVLPIANSQFAAIGQLFQMVRAA
jgi:flagellin